MAADSAVWQRPLPHGALRRRPGPPVRRRGPHVHRAGRAGRDRRPVAVPGVHDGPGGDDRHRQHRRRGRGHRLGRARRALLDLVLRVRRDGREVLGGRARRDVPRHARRPHAHGPDVLPARRPEIAGPRLDLRARRGRRRPDDDAVHADELDRARDADDRRRAAVDHGHRGRGADVAGRHRRDQVDRPRRGKADAAQGRPVPVGRPVRDRVVRLASPGGARARRARGVLDARGRRRQSRLRRRDAVWARARDVCERSRLRHGGCRLRHRPIPASGAAGAERGDGGLHRLVRHVVHFGADDPADRRLALGTDQHRRRGAGLQRGDSRRRRLSRGDFGLPLRVHDAHRLGVLRRAVPDVHSRTARGGAVPLDLLPADSARRDHESRAGLGVGRPDERAAGAAEHHRRARPQRPCRAHLEGTYVDRSWRSAYQPRRGAGHCTRRI